MLERCARDLADQSFQLNLKISMFLNLPQESMIGKSLFASYISIDPRMLTYSYRKSRRLEHHRRTLICESQVPIIKFCLRCWIRLPGTF